MAKLVLDNVVKHHGLPRTIVSDRDRIFTSTFWKTLYDLLDTKLLMSSSYHPQTDGQTERVNKCLEMYLRCVVQESPKQWKLWLPLAELSYNSSFHSALGCSPFNALNRYEASLGTLLPAQNASPAADLLQQWEEHLALLKKHLAIVQNRMKIQADKQHIDRVFQVGNEVLLKLQSYVQDSVASRPYPKLAM